MLAIASDAVEILVWNIFFFWGDHMVDWSSTNVELQADTSESRAAKLVDFMFSDVQR